MTSLLEQLQTDVKETMRARDQKKLGALRLITAAIKQIEVDERVTVDDARMITILDKMAKQRHEAIQSYQAAKRDDLVAQEQFELAIIQHYMPTPLTASEIAALITEAFSTISVQQPSDMGKIMAYLKPKLQGRADMGQVSAQVKMQLNERLG